VATTSSSHAVGLNLGFLAGIKLDGMASAVTQLIL